MAGQGDPTQANTANAHEILGFMTGETLENHRALVDRVEEGVAEQTRLAKVIERGTRNDLVVALGEVLRREPEIAESPVIKKLEADSRPKHKNMPLLDACIDADVPAYLHGEAGSGKSTAAEHAADVRGVNLRAVSLSPTTSKSDLIGYRDANGQYQTTGFRDIFENGGIFLFDEIDNSNPSVLALMNRALAGWENEFPDGVVERNWKTRIMAAANTIGKGATAQYVGRTPIDAATLDRFAMIPWDIDEHLEDQLMKVNRGTEPKPINISKGGIPSAEEWLDQVRGFRIKAQESGLRVVISPRSAIYGRKLAEQGVGIKWLTEMLIFKGMNQNDIDKLSGNYY